MLTSYCAASLHVPPDFTYTLSDERQVPPDFTHTRSAYRHELPLFTNRSPFKRASSLLLHHRKEDS